MTALSTPLLLLALCISGSAPLRAQVPEPAPRIEIVGGETLDLGRQRAGRLERQIAITNRGDDTLTLGEITSGCGCLVGEPDRRHLAPGDTAHLQLTIEASGYALDEWVRTLEIFSNDPRRSVVPFTVRAHFAHEARITSLVSTVQREPCDSTGCLWVVEITNTGDSTLTVQVPLVEEMRGVLATFDVAGPTELAPGARMIATARVTILGEEPIPQALVLFATSSGIDSELRAAFFYVVD